MSIVCYEWDLRADFGKSCSHCVRKSLNFSFYKTNMQAAAPNLFSIEWTVPLPSTVRGKTGGCVLTFRIPVYSPRGWNLPSLVHRNVGCPPGLGDRLFDLFGFAYGTTFHFTPTHRTIICKMVCPHRVCFRSVSVPASISVSAMPISNVGFELSVVRFAVERRGPADA